MKVNFVDLKALLAGNRFVSSNSPPQSRDLLNKILGFNSTFPENSPGHPNNSPLQLEGNKFMFGDISLEDFSNLRRSEIMKVVRSLPEATQNIIAQAVNGKYATPEVRAASMKKSKQVRKNNGIKVKPGDSISGEPDDTFSGKPDDTFSGEGGDVTNITKNHAKDYGLKDFMVSLLKYMGIGGVVFGANYLNDLYDENDENEKVADYINDLIDQNSGCFLESGDGQIIRLSSDQENCNCTTNATYRELCCEKCKAAGDASTLCPGEEANDLWTDPYICPPPPAPTTQSARSRSSIRTNACLALTRAKALARLGYVRVSATTQSGNTCASCGCNATLKWHLCSKQATLWTVLADIAANVGTSLLELDDGTVVFVPADINILKPVLISVGSVMGVVFGVSMGILIARLVKKKRPPQLTLG